MGPLVSGKLTGKQPFCMGGGGVRRLSLRVIIRRLRELQAEGARRNSPGFIPATPGPSHSVPWPWKNRIPLFLVDDGNRSPSPQQNEHVKSPGIPSSNPRFSRSFQLGKQQTNSKVSPNNGQGPGKALARLEHTPALRRPQPGPFSDLALLRPARNASAGHFEGRRLLGCY